MTKRPIAATTILFTSSAMVGYSLLAIAQTEAGDQGAMSQSTGTGPEGAGATSAATLSSPPEPAAETIGETSGTQGGIETVVVTARRTKENIQTVPVAVTALSNKELESQQISAPQDLNGIIPSLSISTGASTRNADMPTLRGQGANISASPGVIMYYDDVPLPSDIFFTSQGGPGKFFDVSNLQVLKGSQGTLFGRNTTGGAIVLSPHKPDHDFDASIKATSGNLEAKGVEGILNVPVIGDQLYFRLGADYYERKGFTQNLTNGQDLDNEGYRSLRLGLSWEPTEAVQNYLLGYYSDSANNGTSEVLERINDSPAGCLAIDTAAFLGGLGNTNCGQTVIAAQLARGVRAVALDVPPDDILDTGGAIDHFDYTLLDGNIVLRNIASYQFLKHHYRWDQDGSMIPINAFVAPDDVNVSDQEQYTDEVQAQGTAFDKNLKYTSGVYYQYIQPAGPNKNVASQFALINTRVTYHIDTRSFGPYTQATYNLGGLFNSLDGLNLTAGARYSWDEISGDTQTGIFSNGGNLIAGQQQPVDSKVSNSALTYTAGLDYKVPTTLLYAKVSRGYKSGGISPQAVTPSRLTFKPEFVFNYELGSKSDLKVGNMPIRMDSALWYTNYTDIQKTATDNNGIQFGAATVNAAKAELMGFETEITAQPLKGLTILANYAYSYGKYSQFNLQLATLTPQQDCTGAHRNNGDIVQLQCVPLTFIPKHQGSITLRYQLPLSSAVGAVDGSATYSYVDRQYTSQLTVPDAEPGAWLSGYGLLKANVDWNSIYGSAFDLQLYGNNLTDKTYRISNSNVWSFLYFQSSIYGPPRMFGMSLTYHWGQ